MLQEIETKTITKIAVPTITLSSAASDAVKNILAERKLEGYALRVYVAGGGCCGVNFGMALDNNFRDVDTTLDINGVQVVVDEVSIEYLRGASIDYVNDPVRGAGFAVDSPNAKGGECSCGSGGHAHASSGSCGCGGGSCACQN
ncbi:MAG TPA: iron-sulfur cluster assembly accessory protein [Anaerolineae bacterium]|nr:iron-sulfur cluster assembly accessory protein [Anaerolineae bacterium]